MRNHPINLNLLTAGPGLAARPDALVRKHPRVRDGRRRKAARPPG